MFGRSSRRLVMESLRLASLTHLHALSFDDLERLAPHATEQWLAAGRRMLLDGSLSHELALIGAGRGLVRCAGETIDQLGPGDVFGRLSTRRCAYETASVQALTTLHLVVFATRAVRELREGAPDALAALLVACSLDAHERSLALAGPRPAAELTLVSADAA
jgi:CRP-like cAMP-binding protein